MWDAFSLLQCSLKVKWNPSERRPEIKSTRTENTSILSIVLAPWQVVCLWLFLSVDQLTSFTTSPHSLPQISSSPMWKFILTDRKLNLTRIIHSHCVGRGGLCENTEEGWGGPLLVYHSRQLLCLMKTCTFGLGHKVQVGRYFIYPLSTCEF